MVSGRRVIHGASIAVSEEQGASQLCCDMQITFAFNPGTDMGSRVAVIMSMLHSLYSTLFLITKAEIFRQPQVPMRNNWQFLLSISICPNQLASSLMIACALCLSLFPYYADTAYCMLRHGSPVSAAGVSQRARNCR